MAKRVMLLMVLAVGMLLTFHTTTVSGRIVESWDYDKLFKDALLVVIAVPVKTDPAADVWKENDWNHHVEAQNTTFKVKHVIQGKLVGDQIKLLHFKFGRLKKGFDPDKLEHMIRNGPSFVEFPIGDAAAAREKGGRRAPDEYLLFLKKLYDGRYAPVSGHLDPDPSIREVSRVRG